MPNSRCVHDLQRNCPGSQNAQFAGIRPSWLLGRRRRSGRLRTVPADRPRRARAGSSYRERRSRRPPARRRGRAGQPREPAVQSGCSGAPSASSSGSRAKSSRRVSSIRGVYSAAAGWKIGIQPHRAPAERQHLRLAVQARDPGRVAAQQLGGEVAERADHRRLDQLDLAIEVLLAVRRSPPAGVAVARRPALEHVRDEHLRARHPDLPQQRLQQFAGATDERHALLVLAGAGGLTHEHQLRVGVAGAEHDRFASRRQLGAAHAGLRLRVHLLENLAPLRGRGYLALPG